MTWSVAFLGHGDRGSSSAPGSTVSSTPSPPTTAPDALAAPISPTGDTAFDAVVTEVARFVESKRGHSFREPVKVDLVDDQAFNKLLLDDFDSGVEQIRKSEIALKALGVVSPSTDLVQEVRRTLTAGVIGFYDSKTKALVIRGTDLTAFTRTTLAHELTHALDDQWFDLDRSEFETADSEVQFGFQALIEGTARWVENSWTNSRTPAERREAAAEEEAFASQVDTSGLSPAIIEILQAPYSAGLSFVTAITNGGGTAALDAAFRAPPVSSVQVLHSSKYSSGEDPKVVAVPPADATAIDDDVLGEMALAQVLGSSLSRSAARTATEGWGGDHFVVWSSPTGQSCLRLDIVGDTPTDSTEIADALRQWAARQPAATVTETVPGTSRLTTCR